MTADTHKEAGGQPTQADAAQLDEAHEAAGDGTLQGSVPAGLTVEELRKRATEKNPSADAATG